MVDGEGTLSGSERHLLARMVRRRRLFLWLSLLNVVVALVLAGYYGWQAWQEIAPFTVLHFVVVVLILLAGRGNLRSYRVAGLLERLTAEPARRN